MMITKHHYDVFEAKELARKRIKVEEAERKKDRDISRLERENDRNIILKAISDSENKTMKAISDLDHKIDSVKTDLEKDILGMKWWTVRTFGGLLMLFSSIIVGAIKLLPTAVHIVEKIPH